MEELSKEYVVSFFNTTFMLHGDRPEAVRWTPVGQAEHYSCLLEVSKNINGTKVLDYGCGKGDFYQFLKERNIVVQYTGYDINKQLISLAKKKYPECTFRVFDSECDTLTEDFDYIFLCGVFNLKVQGLQKTIENTLKKLFRHCRVAMAFNGLSMHNPKKDFELNYISPENLFEFAVKNLSPYVTLRHDTIPYDFTIFIFRENKLKE